MNDNNWTIIVKSFLAKKARRGALNRRRGFDRGVVDILIARCSCLSREVVKKSCVKRRSQPGCLILKSVDLI
jgi:hypothetical protein